MFSWCERMISIQLFNQSFYSPPLAIALYIFLFGQVEICACLAINVSRRNISESEIKYTGCFFMDQLNGYLKKVCYALPAHDALLFAICGLFFSTAHCIYTAIANYIEPAKLSSIGAKQRSS